MHNVCRMQYAQCTMQKWIDEWLHFIFLNCLIRWDLYASFNENAFTRSSFKSGSFVIRHSGQTRKFPWKSLRKWWTKANINKILALRWAKLKHFALWMNWNEKILFVSRHSYIIQMHSFNNVKLFSLQHIYIMKCIFIYNGGKYADAYLVWSFDLSIRVIRHVRYVEYEEITTEHINDEGIKCVQAIRHSIPKTVKPKMQINDIVFSWPRLIIICCRLICIFIKLPLLIKETVVIYIVLGDFSRGQSFPVRIADKYSIWFVKGSFEARRISWRGINFVNLSRYRKL